MKHVLLPLFRKGEGEKEKKTRGQGDSTVGRNGDLGEVEDGNKRVTIEAHFALVK